MTSGGTETLELLEDLIQALAHELNGHLAVIANDLTYIQSLLPEGECARSLRHCYEAAEMCASRREQLKAALDRLRQLLQTAAARD